MKFIRYLGLATLLSCSFDLDSLRGRKDAAVAGQEDGKVEMLYEGGVEKSKDLGNDLTPEDAGLSKDYGNGAKDTGTIEDSSLTVDYGRPDSALPDIGVDLSPDMGSPCYRNDFNENSDLASLVIQEGLFWSRHSEGYLQQTEGGIGGWRIVYFNDAEFSDFEARVMIRMREDPGVEVGVNNKHTGLLFRYTRGSEEGYDETLDHGYVLQMELFNGSVFEFTLEDLAARVVETTRLDCGYAGCQNDNWYELGVRAVGSNITSYWNGEEIFSVVDDTYSSGRIGFACHAFNQSNFDNLEVCEE